MDFFYNFTNKAWTSHQKLDGNKIFQTQSTNYKEYDNVEYGHQQLIKYL
jgi:hypothetical protein